MFDSISLKFGKNFSEVIYVSTLESRDLVGTFRRPLSIIKYSLKVSDGLPKGDTKFTIILRLPSSTSLNSIFCQSDGYCILNPYIGLSYVRKFLEVTDNAAAYCEQISVATQKNQML